MAPQTREAARAELGLPQDRTVVSILGGSQGAHRLNQALLGGIGPLGPQSRRLFFLHQTGAADRDEAERRYRESGLEARVFEFEARLDRVYAASDLVVCRAGALTLQELSYFRVPAVLIPLPGSADDHQRVNARLLAREECAWACEEAEVHAGFLQDLLLSYWSDRENFARRGQRFSRFFRHDGRERFAADVLGRVG
jgi:UDP-N-acetylglucosamine--N-acetylmuramyl-(pentapeptide) pyrophosphoryl-undecaprenol N-acetylglucosamine transferase